MEERGHKGLALEALPVHRVLHGQRGSRRRVEQPPRHQDALPSRELDRPARSDEEVKKDLFKLLYAQMQEQSERWGLPLEKL